MKYKIVYLRLAHDDLREIGVYLSQFYPHTRQNFMADLKKKLNALKDAPYTYEAYGGDPFYRRMIVGEYLVFYHVRDDAQVIETHRILHGARDIRRYI